MPTQTIESDDIRVKIVYNGEVQITYITPGISVDTLREEMRTICGFGAAGPDQFTMKWVDDEGDPCRIASQHELDEALRLYELEKDTEITIHVFPNVPPAPGMPCQGEDSEFSPPKKQISNPLTYSISRFNDFSIILASELFN